MLEELVQRSHGVGVVPHRRGGHRHRPCCRTSSPTTTGTARPGSFAYYGEGQWQKWRINAQETLEPYAFED
jgi:hypothetical protein